jgi:hypothetical protein
MQLAGGAVGIRTCGKVTNTPRRYVMTTSISEASRRDIFDYLSILDRSWHGRFNDREFLARLFDLDALPSTDRRCASAAADIATHTESFDDWTPDWVFSDPRFNLLRCSDEELLRFLVETVHPVVRQDAEEGREMAQKYNSVLANDGWEIREAGAMAGRPVFRANRLDGRVVVFEEPTGWSKVDRQIAQARAALMAARNEEDFQGVGLLCREALISVALHCYDPAKDTSRGGVSPSTTDAKGMLELIFDSKLAGSANEEARAHSRAAVKLSYALQHKRTATFTMAALCLEASVSVVNLLAILFGRRSRV